MNFDLGYLVVLGAVVVILFVYRQLDKNNRSLDKIKKYAETVRHDLNVFVEERTAAVKDFETVLKVHDKTAAEILKRIQAVEANLLTRTPEIEQMQARLDRYAKSMAELEAQTGRVDANLDRLKEETVFVDKVSQRIKASGDQMTALEASIGQIRQEFNDVNEQDLEAVRRNVMGTFEQEATAYHQKVQEAQTQVEEFHKFIKELDLRRLAFLRETENALEAKADELQAAAEASFREAARQAEDLSSVIFIKLEERIEKQAQDSENRLKEEIIGREAEIREGFLVLQSRLTEIDQAVDAARQETQVIQSRTQEELGALQETLKEAARRLRQDFQTEQAQLLNMTAQLKSDLELKVSSVRQQVSSDADSLRNEVQQALASDRQTAQNMVTEVQQQLLAARKDVQEDEQKALEGLEARLQDFEAGFAYRYGKMEEAEKDLAALDQNLRQAMDKLTERIQQEFSSFDEAMASRRKAAQADLEARFEANRTAMDKLDADLEDLKGRAYDNVSEKLLGFEEEFFEDLQKRNAAMTQSIEDWQKAQKDQMDELRAMSERDRTEAEKVMAETMKVRVQELQTSAFQQMDKLERQVHEAQEATAASVAAYRDEVEQTRSRIVEELAGLEKTLGARFEQDRARAELAIGESVTKLERDVDSRIRLLNEGLDQFKADFQSNLSTAETDFGLWQTKFDQRFKELEADLGEQYRAYRDGLTSKITALTDEFSRQKEELITRSADDRTALRTDLAQIRTGIEELESSLRNRTQSAHEAFEREYEAMSQDLQKKNRDLVADIENRIRDYRTAVNETREKAEAMQKKLFGKIEDQASLLAVNLDEIDKRQKTFVAQTKVFERADTLKQELQEAIEDLKGDLARIEVQRKDLFEIEASIARVKKLGDETSEKAARFNAEKKRIDLMDSDFQRILGLSQSMELRLEQVTTSHDLLQDIQLRIRKLEDYSQDIESRYDRLEKRREVLDSTTDGVDRNFALLEKIEKAVRGLDSELQAMPGEVEDLRKRMKVLTQGKDATDKAVERLTQLDQTLRDVEQRIGRMEQAREWLAGVETRLVETKAAADEQVQTLASITRASGAVPAKSRTPDNELRQTVLKLARQGWGKEEISRATKLSLGEVELILELGGR